MVMVLTKTIDSSTPVPRIDQQEFYLVRDPKEAKRTKDIVEAKAHEVVNNLGDVDFSLHMLSFSDAFSKRVSFILSGDDTESKSEDSSDFIDLTDERENAKERDGNEGPKAKKPRVSVGKTKNENTGVDEIDLATPAKWCCADCKCMGGTEDCIPEECSCLGN